MLSKIFIFILAGGWLFTSAIVWTSAATQDARLEFLQLYYKGDYEKAHSQLNPSITDPVAREIWESRLHLQEKISGCAHHENPSAQAFAHLQIGNFENAVRSFKEDWISRWGQAIYAHWNGNTPAAREKIHAALQLNPEYPDLHFFAGDVAETPQQTIDSFTRFLKLNPEDQVKKNIAEFSIELLKKTAGMQLNVVNVDPGAQEIDTDYSQSGVIIQGIVNSQEKMKMLVDTGAGSGLVLEHRDWTPQIVNDVVMLGLGKKQINTTKRVVLDRFETGNFSITNPLAAENKSMPFPDVDGLIGSAAFGTHRILLPIKSNLKELVLLPYDIDPGDYLNGKSLKFKRKATVPFHLVNKLMIVKGRIKKSPDDLDIMIDSGADASLVSIAAAKKYAYINYPLSMQLKRQSKVAGVGGKTDNLLIAENVEIGIAELSDSFNSMLAINFAESSEALGLEIDLLLGRDFLEGYTLLIDYRNRELTFLK